MAADRFLRSESADAPYQQLSVETFGRWDNRRVPASSRAEFLATARPQVFEQVFLHSTDGRIELKCLTTMMLAGDKLDVSSVPWPAEVEIP